MTMIRLVGSSAALLCLCFPGTAQEPAQQTREANLLQEGVAKSTIKLADAVACANRACAGDVLAARLKVDKSDGALAVTYTVVVLRDGKLYEVTVDGIRGEVQQTRERGRLGEEAEEEGAGERKHGQGDIKEEEEGEEGEEKAEEQKTAAAGAAPLRVAAGPAIALGFEDALQGWTVAETHGTGTPGTWAIEAMHGAPSGERVLRLESANHGGTFNLLLSDATHPADLVLRVKIHANTGSEDQGGGLVWRARDANNYYIARWNPLESNLRVYKVENGKRTMFENADLDADTVAWHELAVTMQGQAIRVAFDGVERLSVEDGTFAGAGRVGLWTKADASSSFDDLQIAPLGAAR